MSTRPEDLAVELRDVVVALKDVAGKQWYDLGLQLRLSPAILDTIDADNQTSDECKRIMLRKWLQSDPEASWEGLAAALALIGHETTATKVRSQFVRVTVQVVTETEQDEIREFKSNIYVN
jgi:single-stranded DNA-specific DHH superfamily exonuclease